MLDEFRSTSITWDKATRRIYSPITANASDSNGRKLNIQVVNSGQVENLTGATLHLYWETKDKAHDGLDAFDASDISKGEFEIFYTTGMLSNVGELNATLVLVDSTGKVVSDWFKITVTRGINEGAIESENSFSSLTQALIDISDLEQNYAPRLNDLTAQLQQKVGGGNLATMADLGQDVKTAMTGGSVAVVGAEMVNYINLNSNAVRREILSDEIFEDKTLTTYNATYTNPFVDTSKNYFPSSVLVTLKSSQLINNITVKAKIRNVENTTKVQVRAESASTVMQGTEVNINGAYEINETITVNKTSDRTRVYFFVQGSTTAAKYEIIGIDIYVNGAKTEIVSVSDLAVSFGTGTITNTSKTYDGVAKKSYVDSKVSGVSWSGKKWLIYGDSISDDDFFATKSHYYDKIKADTGILTYPYAVGGSGYATNTTNPPAVAKWGATNNVLAQIDNQGQTNPDIVSIEAGTNDWGFASCVLGSVADILVDNSTFYSLVAQAVRKVKNKYPYAKMFVMTLLPRSDISEYRTKLNANNNTMEQFNQAIRDVCAYYSVPVLDMYRLSQLHSDELQPNWWYDSLHPSALYQTTVMADLVFNFMKAI